MNERIIDADVLCVGGGIAGLMAAIRAGEQGAKVVLAEKANTLRSGAGATGNDHFTCYIPEVHGPDVDVILGGSTHEAQPASPRGSNFRRMLFLKTAEIINLWDSWGIPMKKNGKWEFTGHGYPGGPPLYRLKYAGQNQKPILTKEALKRDVNIVNRVMVYDLLVDSEGVIGALGVDTREEEIIVFRAKSVILGTGVCCRLYPGPTPGWNFNRADPPSTNGDGRAMAFRSGAELFHMEIPQIWAGVRYLSRNGKGTWIGVVRDIQGNPVGPYVSKPDRRYGDVISDVSPGLYDQLMKSGKGPVLMDTRGISDEDYEYMRWGLQNEGNSALVDYLDEEGIDLRKNAVEFMTYELRSRGGISYNEQAETSLPGLYAAGDEYFGAIAQAATLGWIAGENAAEYAKNKELQVFDDLRSEIESKENFLTEIRKRETDVTWQEVNIALQQIMYDYAGHVRAEPQLKAGLTHLLRLKDKTYATLAAKNQHELMHCLEVLNLLDVGETVFVTSIERRESRGSFVRSDYPFIDPRLDNRALVCKKMGEKTITEWKEVK